MTVRSFNGDGDVVRCDPGSALGTAQTGDVTVLSVVKERASPGARGAPFWLGASGTRQSGLSLESYDDEWVFLDDNSEFSAIGTIVPDVWTLVGASRDATTGQVRFHEYNFDTDTWTHSDIGTLATPPSGGNDSVVCLGRWGDDDSDYFDGLVAITAVYDSVMSDTAVEALAAGAQAWADAEPVSGWLFNQPGTNEDVDDFTGNGADQISISGTTVVTDDDPPGFSTDFGEIAVQLSGTGTLVATVSFTGQTDIGIRRGDGVSLRAYLLREGSLVELDRPLITAGTGPGSDD